MSTATLAPDFFTTNYLDRFDTAIKPDWTATIEHLGKSGRPIPDIILSLDNNVTRREVMEVLGVDYTCQGCGEAADPVVGRRAYAAEGDRDVPYCGTRCCDAYHIDRAGNEYLGDPWEVGA